MRGQRVYCSKRRRGTQNGCGRTSPVFLADVLPHHSFSAAWLTKILCALLLQAGGSIKASVEALNPPFTLSAIYALLARLCLRIDRIRTGLFAIGPPPVLPTHLTDPLLHTFEHLRTLFADAPCPIAAFALAQQRVWIA